MGKKKKAKGNKKNLNNESEPTPTQDTQQSEQQRQISDQGSSSATATAVQPTPSTSNSNASRSRAQTRNIRQEQQVQEGQQARPRRANIQQGSSRGIASGLHGVSLTQSALDKLVNKCLSYILSLQHKKCPIARGDVVRDVLDGKRKYFEVVMTKTQDVLYHICGTKLVGIDLLKSGKYGNYLLLPTLSRKCLAMLPIPFDPKEGAALLFLILVISLMNNEISEDEIWEVIETLDLKRPLGRCAKARRVRGISTPGILERKDLAKFVDTEYIKPRYLVYLKDGPILQSNFNPANTTVTNKIYGWGVRATFEFSRTMLLEFVAENYPGFSLEAFDEQYQKCVESEPILAAQFKRSWESAEFRKTSPVPFDIEYPENFMTIDEAGHPVLRSPTTMSSDDEESIGLNSSCDPFVAYRRPESPIPGPSRACRYPEQPFREDTLSEHPQPGPSRAMMESAATAPSLATRLSSMHIQQELSLPPSSALSLLNLNEHDYNVPLDLTPTSTRKSARLARMELEEAERRQQEESQSDNSDQEFITESAEIPTGSTTSGGRVTVTRPNRRKPAVTRRAHN